MSGIPGYWMNETSGVLRPVVEAYLNGEKLTPEQVGTMRAYLRMWVWGDFAGVDQLRKDVEELKTRADIDKWMDTAMDYGIDPL